MLEGQPICQFLKNGWIENSEKFWFLSGLFTGQSLKEEGFQI